jgi:tRNA(Ile)-lysidine synthetase-like protein
MVRRGERVLVAVSGGPDSTALLSLFVRAAPDLGVTLHVAHLDHGWRASSARDAEFVRRLALRFRIPVTVGHIDPAAWKATPARRPAGERRQSSLEARARTLRQRFLRSTAEQVGATRIALGHTLDDQAETLLLRLLRGSGARGLAGIHPVVDGLFIRPLLGAPRIAILSYLKARRLTRPTATCASPAIASGTACCRFWRRASTPRRCPRWRGRRRCCGTKTPGWKSWRAPPSSAVSVPRPALPPRRKLSSSTR